MTGLPVPTGLNSQRGFGSSVERRRKSRLRSPVFHGSSPCKRHRISSLRLVRLPPSRPPHQERGPRRRPSIERQTTAPLRTGHEHIRSVFPLQWPTCRGLDRAHICVRNPYVNPLVRPVERRQIQTVPQKADVVRQVALRQPLPAGPPATAASDPVRRGGTSSTSGPFLLGCPTIVAPFLRRRLLAAVLSIFMTGPESTSPSLRVLRVLEVAHTADWTITRNNSCVQT